MKVIKVEACKFCHDALISSNGDITCDRLHKIVGVYDKRNSFIYQDCPLEDYSQHPKYMKSHDVREYYKECDCEPFQSCNKCK